MEADGLQKARELLGEVTPLAFDCGKRCLSACCRGGDEDGMLLFPDEERYYRGCSLTIIKEDRLGKRLICHGTCERENRPLACRIFPLIIKVSGQEEGSLKANIIMDVRAWPVCPLMKSGRKGLKVEFISAVREAAEHLLREDKHRAFLLLLSKELNEYDDMKRSFLAGRDV
jgi:Fe-S-cluster containining protein